MALPFFFLPDHDDSPPRAGGGRRDRAFHAAAMHGDGLPTDVDDRARVLQIRAGDESAYATLFREMRTPLCEFAATYIGSLALADEVIQDIFLDLWVRRAQWAPMFGVRAYLFRAVRNRVTDVMRHDHVVDRAMSSPWHDTSAWMGAPPAEPGAEADMVQFTRALRDAFLSLPPARHRAALLRWRHGLSYSEIAEALGTSVASVTMHIARAREVIRPVVERFTED